MFTDLIPQDVNLISINQEFTEPTKSQKITKYVGNIVLIAIIVKLVNDVLQYESRPAAGLLHNYM